MIMQDSTAFDRDLEGLRDAEILPAQEELALASQMRRGCRWAGDRPVKANLRFMVNIAK